MKLNKIALQNFRAFHSFEDKLKFDNKNVLIYGENGSGKSSLFWALHAFVNYYNDETKSKSHFTQDDEKSLLNIFNTTEDGFIKITFDDEVEYTYNQSGLTSGLQTQLTNLSRVKSFLTYKDLLGLDMMHSYENEIFAKKVLLELLTGDISLTNLAGNTLDAQERIQRMELLLKYFKEITYFKNLEDFKNQLFGDIENLEFLDSSEVGEFEREDKEGDVTSVEFNAISQDTFDELKAFDARIKSFIEHYHTLFENTTVYEEFLDNWEGSLAEIEKYVYGSDELNEKLELYRYIDSEGGDASISTYIDTIQTTLDDIEENIVNDNFTTKFNSIFSSTDAADKLYSDWSDVKRGIETKVNIINTSGTKSINTLLKKLDYENLDVIISIDYGQSQILDFDVKFNGTSIEHHKFLNEAKLSAINLAFYFSAILSYAKPDIPIFVLDDLLISLDMSNRAKVLELITDQDLFEGYQLFIMTHERSFFEMAKSKLGYLQNGRWLTYEMYIDDSGDNEKPYIRKGKSSLERANVEFLSKNYDCAANLLRKACEEYLFKLLPTDKKFSSTCEKMQLNNLLQNAYNLSESLENKELFAKLQTFRHSIFNPQSHYDNVEIYKDELKFAIMTIENLANLAVL